MLGLAGAAMVMPGCEKTPIQQHDTVYMWGVTNWKNLWPADNLRASADSAEVRYVILKNDGNGFAPNIKDYEVKTDLERVLFEVDAKNRHKVRGKGDLYHLTITNDEYRKWFEDLGFTINHPWQPEEQNNNTKTIGWNNAVQMYNKGARQNVR